MPPHGGGMTGAAHSHDPEHPDDDWNLYAMLDTSQTIAMNVANSTSAVGVFKPFVRRLNQNPNLVSDADEEILVVARFTSPVHVRKLMVIGGGPSEHHPSEMQCFVNHEDIDFTNLSAFRAAQTFSLPVNVEGNRELIVANVAAFSNINCLAFYFPTNHGAENTVLQYIGMQGEHTHYRREAVKADYEVLCTHQNISAPTDAHGATESIH